MTVAIIEKSDKLLVINVSGQLKKEEFDRLQTGTDKTIAQSGGVKILVFAENFTGWERSAGWGDMSFMMEHDADIGKIAVVAEERWRDDMLLFLGAGLREAAVAFFTPAQTERARAWLAAD